MSICGLDASNFKITTDDAVLQAKAVFHRVLPSQSFMEKKIMESVAGQMRYGDEEIEEAEYLEATLSAAMKTKPSDHSTREIFDDEESAVPCNTSIILQETTDESKIHNHSEEAVPSPSEKDFKIKQQPKKVPKSSSW
jgi:hypothetical protein